MNLGDVASDIAGESRQKYTTDSACRRGYYRHWRRRNGLNGTVGQPAALQPVTFGVKDEMINARAARHSVFPAQLIVTAYRAFHRA